MTKEKRMPLKKVCEIIKRHKSFLIASHIEPEGDSLGSQLAMADMLKQLGKSSIIVNSDAPPERYKFLKNINQIILPSLNVYDFDIVLVLDCPVIERIGKVQKIIRNKPIVNIDHHISNRNFATFNYVDPKASSTGEIIYELINKIGCRLNRQIANYLYLAMLTDTGGFRYSNTTFRTLEIAAALLKSGSNPKELYERIYESHSLASRRLLGLCLNTLKVSQDGKVAWLRLRKAMLKDAKASPHDAENFVNYARFINGVRIALLFSDADNIGTKKGFTKVSFRSNENWADVNKIASKFGGGGHVSASGCLVRGSISSVEKKILAEVRKVLK